MIVLIFLVGSLFGLLLGALLCIRFVRQDVAAVGIPSAGELQTAVVLAQRP
jgi:hypothetical protein